MRHASHRILFYSLLIVATAARAQAQQPREPSHVERFAEPRARAELAEREASIALTASPEDIEALLKRAQARLQLDRRAEGLADLERAAALDPTRAGVHAQLALARISGGEFAAAKRAAGTALALDPDDPAAHYALGLLLLTGTTDIQAAIEHFERAAFASPASPEVRFDLLRAHARNGNELETALQLRVLRALVPPSDARVLHGEGLRAAQQGRLDVALSKFREAAQAKPELPSAPIEGALAIARALAKQGKSEQALALFREAAGRFPESIEAHGALAGALQNAGRADEARIAERRVAELIRKLGVGAVSPAEKP